MTQAATLARAQTATHKDDKLYQPLCHQHKPTGINKQKPINTVAANKFIAFMIVP